MIISSAYMFARQISAKEVPMLPPDYWINDAGVDHFHDLKTPTSSNSRPCIIGSYNTYFQMYGYIPDLQSDTDCGVTGAKEISMFVEEHTLQIPLYRDGELSEYSVRFTYRPSSTSEGYWRPEVLFGIYNGDNVIDSHSYASIFYVEDVKKVFVYSGVDTVSNWDEVHEQMGTALPLLFFGIAVAEDNYGESITMRHIGGGYALSAIEGSDTQYSKLSDAWYTRST